MSRNAEEFLVKCISSSSGCTNFDNLRYDMYHDKNFKFYLHQFHCTSDNLKHHIRRAYFQTHLWLLAWLVMTLMNLSSWYQSLWQHQIYQGTFPPHAIVSNVPKRMYVPAVFKRWNFVSSVSLEILRCAKNQTTCDDCTNLNILSYLISYWIFLMFLVHRIWKV